jgi:predicted metal-dependent enzyme (double-stranded beta helix superfamily)
MNIPQKRRALVQELMTSVRAIAQNGVDRSSLARIKDEVVRLAVRRDLFPIGEFPAVEAGTSSMYRLSEDADHRYALYVSCPAQGRSTPPHNHTTWAVIAGVHGREHNKLYKRLDDGSKEGAGRVELAGELDIVSGKGLAMMPDDIHSIHLGEDGPHLNLHIYGMSIEHIHHRTAFDMATGTCRTFPAAKGVKTAEGAL